MSDLLARPGNASLAIDGTSSSASSVGTSADGTCRRCQMEADVRKRQSQQQRRDGEDFSRKGYYGEGVSQPVNSGQVTSHEDTAGLPKCQHVLHREGAIFETSDDPGEGNGKRSANCGTIPETNRIRNWALKMHKKYARYMNSRARPGAAYVPTVEEHIANMCTHGVLVLPSIIAIFWMIHLASDNLQHFIAVIYGIALVVLFGVSTIFHALSYCGQSTFSFCAFKSSFRATSPFQDNVYLPSPPQLTQECIAPLCHMELINTVVGVVSQAGAAAGGGGAGSAYLVNISVRLEMDSCLVVLLGTLKNLFHIGDRAVIYIFIAASYTPWLTLKEYDGWGLMMLWIVWIAAMLGIYYQYTFHEQYKWLETVFYLAIGVCPSVVCLAMKEKSGIFELAFGGMLYISGVVFFKCDGLIPFAHAIWHCFVTTGAVCHYQAVCTYLLGPHNQITKELTS
ncbi:hypothetical protein LSH36_26g11027 [Paralvinella palmiformis]|uniref:Uncharacterized protein n=1 Tax=Paralvinella palmiformis TaxID=53620 RepID=A0AAD9KAI8_9ANNE|nr:hypothetical protein LSH36_26g11027 [Paralvinella palmiformis]